ncbi:TldD/PmbA family protein [Candidatus Haliotispira prima]|uniref:TldD/PmbA family protein n=1 Tax=Candidatus Haliotispira prima TaxID=3034016 RepID=A0ABY8MFN6_9SPIO|nr:TldD/PmbA family protein [Candidatus Haliotispira prima]
MLEQESAAKILEAGKSTGADYVEIFVENTYRASLSLLSSEMESCQSGIDAGVGIRLLFGDQVYYVYSNTLDEDELVALVYKQKPRLQAGGTALRSPSRPPFSVLRPGTKAGNMELLSLDHDVPTLQKVEFLQAIDRAARKDGGDKLSQVYAMLSQSRQKVQIFSSEGTSTEDERNYIRCVCQAIAGDGTRESMGYEAPGAQAGWEYAQGLDTEALAGKVVRRALLKLDAVACPAGKLPVVIDNGFGGVIFHEACGHSLETTSVAKKASVFTDKLGEQIANSCVSAVDDGTLPGEWGSLNFDDEGMPTQRTQLIKDGILQSYMVDLVGSMQTGYARTGSGRRQSYRFAPASRMRNTFIEAGPHKLEELIASIDYGLYAHKMGGGSVSPGTGEFNFAADEAYIIRNGKIAEPVRSASLIGRGEEVIRRISMVADNPEYGQGMCGSVSGSIPANVGQPAIKVDEILIGGDE